MLVQGGLIPRYCCNKYLGCLSCFIAFKVYHCEDTRQVSLEIYHAPSTEMKLLTCINSKILVDSVFTHLD